MQNEIYNFDIQEKSDCLWYNLLYITHFGYA